MIDDDDEFLSCENDDCSSILKDVENDKSDSFDYQSNKNLSSADTSVVNRDLTAIDSIIDTLDKLCIDHDNEDNIFKNNDSDSRHVFNINIPEFRDEVLEKLKLIIDGIDTSNDIRELIWSESCKIIDDFISRTKNNDITIRKNTNALTVADAIIICVIASNEDISDYEVNFDTSGINYYEKNLKNLYPIKNGGALKFKFKIPRGFNSIRDKFTSIIFEKIFRSDFDIDLDTSRIVKKLMKKDAYETILNENEVKIMERLLSRNLEKISKVLMDLGETVKLLSFASRNFKKIGALLTISHYSEYLFNEGVNSLRDKIGFNKNVINIFKYLQKSYPSHFPNYTGQDRQQLSRREMEDITIVTRTKLKLYVIKHIYNGKYYKDGRGCCPECIKEGFIINTDILRLKALEFHHATIKKEKEFSAKAIFELFSKNRHRIDVLDYVVNYIENEGVVLLCRNHHAKKHAENIMEFDYLINFNGLLSFPAEVIRLMIYISVDSHPKYEDAPKNRKYVKQGVLRALKKRHLISSIYGEYCHTCGEVLISKFISSFTFHHLDKAKKTMHAKDLFLRNISDILDVLIKEVGSYICSNCHRVYHYEDLHLLNRIYEDQDDVNTILKDYHNVRNNIIPINKNMSIDDIFQTDVVITNNIIRYLLIIFELQEQEIQITTKILSEYLGLSESAILTFFTGSKEREQFLKKYITREKVNFDIYRLYYYSLTSEGTELAILILHFRDYYENLENY